MDTYEKGLRAMEALFGRDYQFALATAANGTPSVRFVDTFYNDGCFYIVSHAGSRKVKEIQANPAVSLCSRKMHAFSGTAENIGHPLKPENAALREGLIEVFKPWYFRHNNEADAGMCYLRVTPETGFVHIGGVGYKMDFMHHTAREFPFSFDTTLTEE